MRVILPWPDPRLFPNYKRSNHWRKFRANERDARALGWGLASEQISPDQRAAIREITGHVMVTATFYPPDRRSRDDDGMIGAIKNYRDGICDAIGIDDKRLRVTYQFADPEKPGRVEFAFCA